MPYWYKLKNSIQIRAWDTLYKCWVRYSDFRIFQNTRGHIFAISKINNHPLKIYARPYRRK